MKIFAVVVKSGEEESLRLVRAESHAKATAHVMRVVTTRVATQADMLRIAGPDAVEIELAKAE